MGLPVPVRSTLTVLLVSNAPPADSPDEPAPLVGLPALARVARLAAACAGTPWAMVNIVGANDLQVVASHGLRGATRAGDTFPLGHVPCALAAGAGTPLVVADATADARLRDLPAVGALGMRGYAGVPFRAPDGRLAGTVCAMDPAPRVWRDEAVAHLTDLAALVEDELALRAEVVERRRARAEEARFRALVEHTSELIALLDPDGRATYASPAFARVLEHSPRRLGGWGIWRLVHPDERAAARAAVRECLREASAHREFRVRARHARGGWRTLHVVAENLTGDPALGAVVLNARDVTHQTALEAQLGQVQKLEALGRLAGGVAHDFNNLLTVIGTSARFARDAVRDAVPPALGAEALADLDGIDRAVDRAGALTRQLLAFSRARDAEPRSTALADVLRAVEGMARRVVGDDVEVVSLVDEGAGRVLADPGQLEQVLLNLVVNARDAMPEGGVLILETRRAELHGADATRAGVAPGAWSVLEVTDTGVGMDAATQARVFEPFFTTKPEGRGTGLGLATALGIVSQAGGRLTVQSRRGRGTTFTVLLPRLAAGGRADVIPPEPALPAPCRARARETVLVVEDEAGVRHVARRVLERYGYRVLEARHGAEGLRVWLAHGGASGQVDLVLTDLSMPEVGGRELVARVRARRPAQGVAVMTANAAANGLGALDAGGLPIVHKPFYAAALASVVREAIDRAGSGSW